MVKRKLNQVGFDEEGNTEDPSSGINHGMENVGKATKLELMNEAKRQDYFGQTGDDRVLRSLPVPEGPELTNTLMNTGPNKWGGKRNTRRNKRKRGKKQSRKNRRRKTYRRRH